MKISSCGASTVSKSVVELFHRDLSVTVMVESSHESMLFVVCDEDIEGLKSSTELREVDKSITVRIKLLEDVDNPILESTVLSCRLLNLGNNVLNSGLRELIGVVLHVFLSVLVG